MRPNLPFLSAASNANLYPGGPLKRKKWLVKEVKLSPPPIEVMKIVRLTPSLPDMPRLSSPRPRLRLRYNRRLALPSHLNLTLNLCTLSFVLSLAPLPPSNCPNCSCPQESASVFADYLRSHFPVSEPNALRSRARGYLSELCRATCSEESHSSFCCPFPPLKFLRLPQTSLRPLPLTQTKLLISC